LGARLAHDAASIGSRWPSRTCSTWKTACRAGDEIERLNYGWSILHCLAVGMMDADSAGTGTVIRPDTVRAYAAEAGFARVDVLPIEHDSWRFYRLVS
jgi:hypothetical protein